MKKNVELEKMLKGAKTEKVIFKVNSGGGNIGINKIFKKGDTLAVNKNQFDFLIKHKIAEEYKGTLAAKDEVKDKNEKK